MPALWRPGPWRAAARLPLLVPAAAYRAAGLLRHTLGTPRAWDVAGPHGLVIGNLTVGGTGKTPIVAWCTEWLARRGARPGVVTHPAAADEATMLEGMACAPVVIRDRDRHRGGLRALAAGADAVVFDDGLQHPGLAGLPRVALVATEQERLSRWPVPAGPWRAPRRALADCDLIVVTRKSASRPEAAELAAALAGRWNRPAAVAALTVDGFQRLHRGDEVARTAVRGRSVLVVAGIADPAPFHAQLEALGARVAFRGFPDHHPYHPRDVTALLEESGRSDYVVVTSKDAAKLRTRWPDAPDPLVAKLAVHWEAGVQAMEALLARLAPTVHGLTRNLRQAAAGTK